MLALDVRSASLLVAPLPLAPAAPVSARCARPSVVREARRSLYVIEGRLETFEEDHLVFVVTAVWQGTPPERVTISNGTSRRRIASPADVGTTFIVLAGGDPADGLHASSCGHTAPLASSASTIAELQALGLTRTAR